MTQTMTSTTPPGIPSFFAPVARLWMGLTPRLVPILAVLTAFIAGIPLIIITGGGSDIGKGIQVAGLAYSALIESITGLTINDVASPDDFDLIRQYAATNPVTSGRLSRQALPFERLATIGVPQARNYLTFLDKFPQLDEETVNELGERIDRINTVGDERLRAMQDTLAILDELGSSTIRELTILGAGKSSLSPAELEQAAALWPLIDEMETDELRTTLGYLTLINTYSVRTLQNDYEALLKLDELGIDVASNDAATLVAIFKANVEDVLETRETLKLLDDSRISDPAGLAEEYRLLAAMYEANYIDAEDVNEALDTQVPGALEKHLIIRRPGNRVLRGEGVGGNTTGIIKNDQNLDVHFLHAFGSVFLFFPGNLEETIVRAIPFVIAGLAVALGFKAGVFNIGAEGQIYAGAILVAGVGAFWTYSGPSFSLIVILIALGIFGGFLWGAIPGMLKAFTGAHEVITTIMMNFIAVLTVDWLIKFKEPYILGDPNASVPQTPTIQQAGWLPTFNEIWTNGWFISYLVVVAILVFSVIYLAGRRRDPDGALRNGIMLAVGSALIQVAFVAITVRGSLHIGILMMFAAVWLADWFLNRTTVGFEIRTVGLNQNAARYAGMSVARNVVLAMALSGALAGLAGAIEISGKIHHMKPAFFGGVGFDAIAVALLARSNPRNMIWAGFLWGGMAAGGDLMQIRASISIDLVKIIQALIIMFIAADQIIRFLWRVPETAATDEAKVVFGWGS